MSEWTTHREQAVHDLAADLAVTAGAGAGKTTVLVDRFVKIAREPGLGPDRILAITFTRKAAAEMKERVIREFERAGDTGRRRQTEAAYISTIHGFAERVLRERPFDARIDPAFQVLTEYDQALFVEEALGTMYARDDLRTFAQRLGKELSGEWRIFSIVRDVARLMREGPDSARTEAAVIADAEACVALAVARARDHVTRCERDALATLRELEPRLASAPFKSRKAMYDQAQVYLEAVRGCLACGSLSGAADPSIWSQTRFTGQLEAGDHADAVRALLGAFKPNASLVASFDPVAEEALERELIPVKRAIYDAARAIDQQYQQHKRSTGRLDFHDLQRRAFDLFAEVPAVREEYVARFRHLLLDESQDTDELQHRLVRSIRSGENVLFMVGDPKQAIFEFRGADPDVFQSALANLAEPRRLALPENFRSRREIVAFVNGLGPALLPEQFAKIEQRGDYGGTELDGAAVTSILAVQAKFPDDGGRPRYEPVADARPREAAAVAEEIGRLLRSATVVRDPEDRDVAWVPLRPRHVAVLFRTRTAIPYFERAFAERGIPYVTAAGEGFYERAEVLDCMCALRALEQPLDDLALAAILRSPMVGASDDDLWRLRRAAGEGRPLYRGLRGDATLSPFRARWDELRRTQRGRSAADALDAVIAQLGYEAALAAHADGPAMLANVAKLRRQLRELGAVSCGEAYAELTRRRELMDRESQAALVGTADDVVVFTTIHQAKGLEWPVVCLANLQNGGLGTLPAFSARHGVLTIKALDDDGEEVAPLSIAAIADEAKARAEAEERRLLYVALTRARERLILSATVKASALERTTEEREKKQDAAYSAPLDFLLAHTAGTLVNLAPDGHDCGSYRTAVQHVHSMPPVTPWEGGEPLARSFAPTVAERVEPDAAPIVALPTAAKVTELLAFRRCPQVYRFAHVLEIDEHLPRRAAVRGGASEVSPVELGTIVHRLLERARFGAPDLAAEAERLVGEEDERLHDKLRPMLLDVLRGEVGDAIRSARRVEREWPFATSIGGVLVDGVIDLAVQGADGRWTVFDYKSNDYSRSGRFEYLVDYYTPQLELYALALANAGLGEVGECALVFLIGGRVQRWRVDPSTSATGEMAASAIARIGAGDFATTPGPKCELCGYRKRKVCSVGRGWTPPAVVADAAVSAPAPLTRRRS